mgnify:CR=1 FL=1
MAKTQFSFSTDPNLKGAPSGHVIQIREMRLAAGAGLALYNVVGGNDATISASAPPVPVESAIRAGTFDNMENSKLAQARPPDADAEYGEVVVAVDDFVLGEATAPVTIIEYSSLTCSHCARFHDQVLPALKKGLIASGKIGRASCRERV